MNKCLYCNAVILPPCTNFCNGTCASEYNRKQTPMSDAKQPSIEDVDVFDLSETVESQSLTISKLREGLEEIAKGQGAYDLNPLKHCANAVENMREIAKSLLNTSTKEQKEDE
jgi:hypothetical protein